MRSVIVAVVLALPCVLSCGSGQKPAGPQTKPTLVEARFPVAAKVPARATWVIATQRLDDSVELLRDFLRPLGAASDQMVPDQLDAQARREWGLSPIHPADLADAGFAVDRGVALYSTGLLPTLLLPVADAEKVRATIEKLFGDEAMLLREHRGVRIMSSQADEEGVAAAMVGDWLVVHVFVPEVEGGAGLAWLDEILDLPAKAGAAIGAAQADLEWAMGLAPEGALVGVVRVQPLLDAVKALDKLDRPEADCSKTYALTDGIFGRVALYGSFSEGRGEGGAFVELTPEAMTALSRRVAAAPDAAYLGVRDEAAVSISAGIDLDWLGGVGRSYKDRCGIFSELVDELDLDELDELVPGATSYHGSLLGARVAGSSLDVEAAVWLGVGDEGAVREFLDTRVPKLIRARTEVGGVEVDEVPLDLVGLSSPLRFLLQPSSLRLAIGRGVMERLLAAKASTQPAAGSELLSFALRPDKIPDTRPAIELLVRVFEWDAMGAEMLVRALASFRNLTFSATVEKHGVRLSGGFELR
jgi:hypothetical protein